MAFAPPRRPSRSSDHRRPIENKGVETRTNNAKNQQKVRTVIEERHREWLSEKQTKQKFESSECDPNTSTRLDPTQLTEEASLFRPSVQEVKTDIQLTEYFEVLDVNSSNQEGAYSYGYPNKPRTKLATREKGKSLNSDEMLSGLQTTKDYLATVNKFKISKSSGLTTSGSNMYGTKPKVANKSELVVTGHSTRESSAKQLEGEPMTTAELRRKAEELINQAKSSLHRYGRANRPENHFCPFCKRLMGLEGHDPVCIIPCGHSVCEPCTKNLKKTCSICNHDIQTTTKNIVLKRIIEQFSDEEGVDLKQNVSWYDSNLTGKTNSVNVNVAETTDNHRSQAGTSPVRSVQTLTQRLDEIQQNRKNYLTDGTSDGSYMLPDSVNNKETAAPKYATGGAPSLKIPDTAPMTSFLSTENSEESKPQSKHSAEVSTLKDRSKNEPSVEGPAIIPQIANINKQLTNLLKPYCSKDQTTSASNVVKIEKEKIMFEDVPDYKPSETDLKKWTGELAAVEMRLSVMDLQARQTSNAIMNAEARISNSKETLLQLEHRETQLLENLRFTQLQLKEADMERSKILQQIKNDAAENERCCEQLNLINYTKAGLEAELDKLRLLCNRAT